MDYQGNVIRPPSEAGSILLQVTTACSHNACAFCGAYRGERFAVKDEARIFADIEYAAARFAAKRRLFLLSGDALAAPAGFILRVLERIRERLPRVARVASYANAGALRALTPQDLARMRELGLSMIYMGLESGDDELLAAMNKQAATADMLEQAGKLRAAGIKLSVTVILGLAGTGAWERHARATGEALSRMDPEQAAALTLIPVPGTALWRRIKDGRFVLPDARAMLAELRLMLEHTQLRGGLFLADHASNYLPLKLRLPKDKREGLELIDAALAGRLALTPERARGL